jgi:hypothetical protein
MSCGVYRVFPSGFTISIYYLNTLYFGRLYSGSPSLLSNGYREAISPGLKRPGSNADHSPPSTAEVKNGRAIAPLADMFSWHGA